MRIVVLDGYTLNPGDLSWDGLRAFGPCTVYERTPAAETASRAADAEIVVNNKVVLTMMKPSAYMINMSRSPLVDEVALADALSAGCIAGAGLDVLSTEPPPADNPLLTAKNCCITPHIAWATRAARQRLLDTAVANVRAFLAGKLQNVVNPQAR